MSVRLKKVKDLQKRAQRVSKNILSIQRNSLEDAPRIPWRVIP